MSKEVRPILNIYSMQELRKCFCLRLNNRKSLTCSALPPPTEIESLRRDDAKMTERGRQRGVVVGHRGLRLLRRRLRRPQRGPREWHGGQRARQVSGTATYMHASQGVSFHDFAIAAGPLDGVFTSESTEFYPEIIMHFRVRGQSH